jgi:hypothetical protein
MSRHAFSILLVSGAAALAASCGSGDKHLALGGSCTLNSECKDPLVCKFGSCHQACMQSRDCPTGERCVQVDSVGVCQQQTESQCTYGGTVKCKTPLICAADNICRNTCTTADNCLKNQECVASVCLETAEAAAWRADAGAGVGLDGGADAGGTDTDADAAATTTDTAGGSVDAGTIIDAPVSVQNDAPLSAGDVPRVPDLQPTDWGVFGYDASITVAAVAEPVSARPGEEVTITVAGAGITNPKNLTLGSVLADKVTISEATSVSFKAKLSVPHGLAPAIVDLGFSCQGGQATASAVLQVVPISVAIDGADTNRGTPDNPFRTVTKAGQTAGRGDTIQVGSGEFTLGETWPITLQDKTALSGVDPAQTRLSYSGSSSADAIVAAGDATVRGLSLRGFYVPLLVNGPKSAVLFEDIDVAATSTAIQIDSSATNATVTIAGKQTSISTTDYQGLIRALSSYTAITLRDGEYIVSSGSIISASGTLSLLIQDAAVGVPTGGTGWATIMSGCTGTFDIRYVHATVRGDPAGCDNGMPGKTTIESSSFLFPSVSSGFEVAGTITASNSSFEGGTTQVALKAGSTGIFRNCSFSLYSTAGIDTVGNLDLGTAAESGGNQFTGTVSGSVYGLLDSRPAGSTATITVGGTSFNGVVPPAGVVTKSTVLAACEPGAYCIKTDGNSITFF